MKTLSGIISSNIFNTDEVISSHSSLTIRKRKHNPTYSKLTKERRNNVEGRAVKSNGKKKPFSSAKFSLRSSVEIYKFGGFAWFHRLLWNEGRNRLTAANLEITSVASSINCWFSSVIKITRNGQTEFNAFSTPPGESSAIFWSWGLESNNEEPNKCGRGVRLIRVTRADSMLNVATCNGPSCLGDGSFQKTFRNASKASTRSCKQCFFIF